MFDGRAAKVLIVDDNEMNRKKLSVAVGRLDYETEVAENGVEALDRLRTDTFDAVLLDLLMPEMDGFEVMRLMKEDPVLRDVPIIVISDLEGEPKSVSRAISLGAEDFLPKGFDPTILNARLTASLRKKRFRDQELEYFRRVQALTGAAQRIQSGAFDETQINALERDAQHDDPIGQLTQVFRGMATEIHAREVKLLERIRLLQGILLLVGSGAAIGFAPSLSRLASSMGSQPLGLVFWVDVFAALLCLAWAMLRGGMPKLSRKDWKFFAIWAFIIGILQHGSIFLFAAHVEAAFLTMILALASLMVYCFAVVLRVEKLSFRKVIGVLIGAAGISLALFDQMTSAQTGSIIWLFAALIIPAFYAVENLFVADSWPEHVDVIAGLGVAFAISAGFALPLAVGLGQTMPIDTVFTTLGLIMLAMAVLTILANALFVLLLDLAGAVFTSLTSYCTALAGIFWAMLILGERPSLSAWIAIGVVFAGIFLVGTKDREEPVTIQRDYGKG